MKTHTIAGIEAVIDDIATRDLYSSYVAKESEEAGLLNFRKNLLRQHALFEEYFKPLGIDPKKVQNISVIEIDPFAQRIMYYGEYPVIGTISVESERILNDPDLCQSEKTSFGCELNYTMDTQKNEECLAISFCVYFPWLFYDKPIQIPKYINQVVLPDIKNSKTIQGGKEP